MYNTILKAVGLFLGIFIVMPLLFFVLVGFCGKWFSLSVDKNSWFAKVKGKLIK